MPGLNQSWPLTADRILDHAAQWRPDCEIVARTAEGQIQRTTYGALGSRTRRLASALSNLGVKQGDRVAILGANTPRALEAIYAAIGLGAVAHPLAPGLDPARLAALIDRSQDTVLFVDPTLLSGLDETLGRCASLRHVVVMEDAARMPQTGLTGVSSHDSLIAQASESDHWGGVKVGFGEGDPCILFHTVGAGAGAPKGVLWPHRSTVLAALIASDAEALGFTAEDVVMPMTPFWRSAAWGLVFAAPAAGCKLVLPGQRLDPGSVLNLIAAEGVTFVLGSPSEIEALADQMHVAGRPPALRRMMIVGAACPPALVESLHKDFGIEARCAWGMVEACGLGAIGAPDALRPPFGVDLEIADASGNRLPHDGLAIGRLKVRGPAAASAYYPEGSGPVTDPDGYLDTGDLAAIDANGRVRIADRADEVMSAGGAWVSPRAIEAIALEHPATADAAVIAFPDAQGESAPLLVVRRKPGATAGRAEYLAFVAHRLKSGQKPADAIFVDALPLDIAGRVDKRTLRDRLERHRAQALGIAPPPAPAPAAPTQRPRATPVAAAPLLYSPELEPRARRDGSSEFAPLPAPAAPAPVSSDLPADLSAPAPETTVAPETTPIAPPADEVALDAAPAPVESLSDAPNGALADALSEAPAEPTTTQSDPALATVLEPSLETPATAAADVAAPQQAGAPEMLALASADDAPLTLRPALSSENTPSEAASIIFPTTPKRVLRPTPKWAKVVLTLTMLIAVVPLALTLASVIAVRFELIDWRIGLNDLGYAWPFKAAMVGVVSGIVGVFAALLAGFRRLWRRALVGLLLPIASLAGLVTLHSQAEQFPPVHDVATDWRTPILFSPALVKLRGPAANAVEADPVVPAEAGTYMYRRVAEVNADTCPAAKPVLLAMAPGQAYARTKALIEREGLALVTADAAGGRLEATAASAIYRFKTDVAFRITANGAGSQVDMRAISRVGLGDRGQNCALVGALATALRGGD